MSALVVIFYVIAAIACIDALRRSPSEWIEADRNKGFWIAMLVLLNGLGVLIYVLFVVPRFAARRPVHGEFLKHSAGQRKEAS